MWNKPPKAPGSIIFLGGVVLGIKLHALPMLGKCPTPELTPQAFQDTLLL
jgi:hypothetical protein